MSQNNSLPQPIKFLTGSVWGIAVLFIGGILLILAISEVLFLTGDKIYGDYLGYNKPLSFEALESGERFRVVIQSRNKKVKQKIMYTITGPNGIVVDDIDGYRKPSRAFYFNAEAIGTYTLMIDNYYNQGGDDLPPEAAKYVNAKYVDIYRGDRTRVLGIIENFIVLW